MRVDSVLLGHDMSIHRAFAVPFKLVKHPDADRLSIATIKGWTAVVNTEDFVKEKLGVYIPIDMIASTDHPILGFLDGKPVKTKKLRGVISQGVLLPLSKVATTYNIPKSNIQEGQDLTDLLQLKRWTAPEKFTSSSRGDYATIKDPDGLEGYTDIENWKNFPDIIKEGEQVVLVEKGHGSLARYSLVGGIPYISSKNNTWRIGTKEVKVSRFGKRLTKILGYSRFVDYLFAEVKVFPEPSTWWNSVYNKQGILEKLTTLSTILGDVDVVVYGEILGMQDLKYGNINTLDFYAFDVKVLGQPFKNFNEFEFLMNSSGFKICPVLKKGVFDIEDLKLRSGKTTIGGDHIREGLVIRPIQERTDPTLGRVILKCVSEDYLLRKKAVDVSE